MKLISLGLLVGIVAMLGACGGGSSGGSGGHGTSISRQSSSVIDSDTSSSSSSVSSALSSSQASSQIESPVTLGLKIEESRIVLDWDIGEDLKTYNLYYASQSGINSMNYHQLTNGKRVLDVIPPYSPSDIFYDKDYYFVVTEVRNNVEGQPSNEVKGRLNSWRAPNFSGGKLNDTGIINCVSSDMKEVVCDSSYGGQDAVVGRDLLAQKKLLNKVGDGVAAFDFMKLDASGNPLNKDAEEWACVKDNHTGLIWQRKTDGAGLLGSEHTYSWYEPNAEKNGGHSGVMNGGSCQGSRCDTAGYISAVNAISLCGKNDWRLPSVVEIFGIIDNNYSSDWGWANVDADYFGLPSQYYYVMATPDARDPQLAWCVIENTSVVINCAKRFGYHVLLVSDGN